jgi:cytochrome c peroxidase
VACAVIAGAVGAGIARGDEVQAPALGLPPSDGRAADNAATIALGHLLFGTKVLSFDASVGCETCHVPALAFSGPEPVAIGIGGVKGTRHPPPLINLYWEKEFMLDGRAPTLEAQIHIPMESPTEMNIAWPVALTRLAADRTISAAAARAGALPFTRDGVVKSLAAYVRSLISGGSPFDRYYYLGDQTAISTEAKFGLDLFVRKGRCSGCHLITGYSAPLSDGSFHSVGIGFSNGVYTDPGRFAVTGLESDRGAFKTPTLRDVALRRYFMHDGSMSSLREVLDYYNRGGSSGPPNLDGRIRSLYLTSEEEDAIIAFLKTLTSVAASAATANGDDRSSALIKPRRDASDSFPAPIRGACRQC